MNIEINCSCQVMQELEVAGVASRGRRLCGGPAQLLRFAACAALLLTGSTSDPKEGNEPQDVASQFSAGANGSEGTASGLLYLLLEGERCIDKDFCCTDEAQRIVYIWILLLPESIIMFVFDCSSCTCMSAVDYAGQQAW